MAATTKLSDTIAATKPYVNWANLTIGDNLEPALTAANMTLQTIVGPPFIWPWNRSTASFMAVAGVQDYNAAISSYGWLESATLQAAAVITSVTILANQATYQAVNNFANLDGVKAGSAIVVSGCTSSFLNGSFSLVSANATSFTVTLTHGNMTESESGAKALAGKIMPLELVWKSQGEATEQDRPTFISTQISDESGTTFTFRLLPVPEQSYQVNLTFQQSPQFFSATIPGFGLSQTWGIPDQLQYIYTYFFMFFMLDYFEDARAARYRQLAIASLLARQGGLSQTDRNLFLGNWLPLMKEEQSSTEDNQQATQAKGL